MDTDVLIIGGGSAGLGLAYELLKRDIKPAIIDEAAEVASSWRRRHEQLRLNTFRTYSSQPGSMIPRRYGAHITRDDYITYLEGYAADLGQPVNFGVSAKQIRQNDHKGWLVETNQGEINARQVVVATGPERQPYTPDWPGRETYQGEIIHSSQFHDANDYAGKSILIVGPGNSGFDIGNHLARVEVAPSWVSVRTGPTVVPQYVFGLSAHRPLIWISWLPIKVQDFMVAMLGRIFVGDLRKVGLPAPLVGAITRDKEDGVPFAVDTGFARALKDGRFTVVPEISSFSEQAVHLIDGRTLEPDVIICATGYRLGLESLVGDLEVLDERGKPMFLADQASDEYPGLWFFGLNPSIYGYMYTRKKEAPRLADKIALSLRSQSSNGAVS